MPRGVRKTRKDVVYSQAALVAALVFALDFFLKSYLRLNYQPFHSIPIIQNILHITLVFNKGAAFGILQGKTAYLIYISFVLLFLFILFARREGKDNLAFWLACGLIFGGACSNLYDRIVLGYVVDYIDLRIWPVFNLSDSCITIGIGLIFLQSFRQDKRHGKEVNRTAGGPPPASG